ncbi:hypothetical protein EVAR_3491_1 [Eumeta japonica]|uniref:Uncharacterized protein n=1 Tax=Eumeta variegata TaxID=151549 RepID=A0A4C1SV18_EUMVA|nr:hypothetical protein EVAR_3491_1 [Eumeta japonica]
MSPPQRRWSRAVALFHRVIPVTMTVTVTMTVAFAGSSRTEPLKLASSLRSRPRRVGEFKGRRALRRVSQ